MNAIAQTLKLSHTADIFALDISGKTQVEIIEALKESGYSMGKTSLRNLLNGNVTETCGFQLVDGESKPTIAMTDVAANDAEVKKEEVIEPEAAPVLVEEKKEEIVEVEEVAPAVEEVKVETAPVIEEVKPEVTLVVNAPAVATGPKAMRRGTKNDQIFQMLCVGATVKEICAAFKWTEGAVSSVVYWEPNAKGYGLTKEKVEGRGTVLFLTVDGQRIDASKLVYTK